MLVPLMFTVLAVPSVAHALLALTDAFSHPGARAVLTALYYVLRATVAIAFAAFTLRRAQPQRRSRDPVALLACGVAMVMVLPFGGPGPDTARALMLAGDVIAVTGCAWLLISVLALGRCFGVLPEARGLVTRGPYRLVRHPIYLGEITALFGLTLSALGAWNVAALVAFVAAQLVRMRREEAALRTAFAQYAVYAARTPRLLPLLVRLGGGTRRVTAANPEAPIWGRT